MGSATDDIRTDASARIYGSAAVRPTASRRCSGTIPCRGAV